MGLKEKKRERERIAMPAQKIRAFVAKCHNTVIICLIALIDRNSMLLGRAVIINVLSDRFYRLISQYLHCIISEDP